MDVGTIFVEFFTTTYMAEVAKNIEKKQWLFNDFQIFGCCVVGMIC